MAERVEGVERATGADALKMLADNVGSVTVDVEVNGILCEVEFRVPVGPEATSLQEDVVGFVMGVEKDDKDLKHAQAAWGR